MTTVDRKGIQRVFKRVITGNVKRIIYGQFTLQDAIKDVQARFNFPGAEDIARTIFEKAESIDKAAPEEFYCGRCMRFFGLSGFSESNREKAINGEGGYCLECSKMKVDGVVDFENGKVEVVPIGSKPVHKEKKPEQNAFFEDDPTIESLVAAIKTHYANKAVMLTYVEIVFKNQYQSRLLPFLETISDQWMRVSTDEHTILSAILLRPLDQDEINLISEFSVSLTQREKNQSQKSQRRGA